MIWLLVVIAVVLVGFVAAVVATRRRKGNVGDELGDTFKFSPPF